MALQAAYRQFLAAPSSAALAADASLHYITSTTSHRGATEIIKHFASQRNQLKKKKEEILNIVEGKNAIAAEIDTTLEFVISAGSYLPGLDDNFVADRTVYIPIIHIVTFDADGKIIQIRQNWDQGALLKQLDVIGKSGRNWPIRDSTEQIKLIANSTSATAGQTAGDDNSSTGPLRSRGNSTNALRDPHASLALFAPREELESAKEPVISPYAGTRPRQRSFTEILGDAPEDDNATPRAVVSPYAGTRPRQRSFAEILGDEPEEEVSSPTSGRERSESVASSRTGAPKAGAAKHFQPIRVFEGAGDEEPADSEAEGSPDKSKTPERAYRPNPKRYNHFNFADGSDPQEAAEAAAAAEAARRSNKHDSQWSFEDFVTPQKVVPSRARAQDVRHWSNVKDELPATPARKIAPNKPRRDAEKHFEFRDDGVPGGELRLTGRPRGSTHNSGLGLYENNVYSEDGLAGSDPGPDPRALGNITNLKGRSGTFEAHFNMTDDSPQNGKGKAVAGPVSDDRQKAVKMMESSWDTYDSSPGAQKENKPLGAGSNGVSKERGIQITGDGMGGKKGGGGRGWGIGESDDESTAAPTKPKGGVAPAATKSFWDF